LRQKIIGKTILNYEFRFLQIKNMTSSKNILSLLLFFVIGNLTAQSFKAEIPTESNPERLFYYQNLMDKSEALGLEKMNNGISDSLEIRLWINPRRSSKRKLIRLVKTEQGWQATKYDYVVKWIVSENREAADYLKSEDIYPEGGWTALEKTTFSNGIVSLKDMDDLSNIFDDGTEGDSYFVEVATQSYYRFYRYHFYERFIESYQEVKNFDDWVATLQELFNMNFKSRW
jgi:hypothetical protein